jgi:schlafen family protein
MGSAHDPRSFYDSLDSMEAIVRLLDPPLRESQTLEYKDASRLFGDRERESIAKEVCALANSSGGVIIYGIEIDKSDRTRPVRLSGFDVRNVESFDQAVATRVQKPVAGLERKLLPANAPQVMVVYVPKSPHSPHQDTVKARYFYRAGTVSQPMTHDLVELHFGRRLGPMLQLHVARISQTPGRPGHLDLELRLSLENHGQRVARYVEAIVWLPGLPLVSHTLQATAKRIDHLHGGTPTLQYTSDGTVVHPTMRRSIIDAVLSLNTDFIEPNIDKPFIQWVIYADEMERQIGERTLRELGVAP